MLQHTRMFQNQLVTKLHTTEVDHRILHGLLHETALAGLFTLHQGSQQTDQQMHTGIAVAKSSSRLGRNVIFAFPPPGSCRCTTGTLSYGFKSLHTGQRRIIIESLDGAINDTRIDLMHILPREAQLVDSSRMQVFYKNISGFQQSGQDLLAFRCLHIEFDGTLVAVQL